MFFYIYKILILLPVFANYSIIKIWVSTATSSDTHDYTKKSVRKGGDIMTTEIVKTAITVIITVLQIIILWL